MAVIVYTKYLNEYGDVEGRLVIGEGTDYSVDDRNNLHVRTGDNESIVATFREWVGVLIRD